ncbi:hypothetical protein JW916_06755 [Candidatus Sumerlaeota bacterium]|nr:hypothetical protein [Candidatus Sumerlaeota bacterium]
MRQIESTDRAAAPAPWALKQRSLIDRMNDLATRFVERYVGPDGDLVWRREWPGIDGSDDGYEGFAGFPLFYALGGGKRVHGLGREMWETVTRQFTRYGQVHNEFDAHYDWMHHGESSLLLYYLGLCDPNDAEFRRRATRFAGMYMGENPEARNWDARLKMIRSPLNGSRGPRFETTAEDWSTHRWVYDMYLAPFEDVPGYPTVEAPLTKLAWTDDKVFAQILPLINRRMTRGDVPLNLAATSLATHAFLYTGEEKYREWVLEYLDAWRRRAQENGGLLPDNVGLSGKIGEYNDGKWWGGYYGYRWSHGWRTIVEASLIAASNAVLLTGDLSHLDLPRSQLDRIWEQGKTIDGEFQIPYRYGDAGWFDYRKPNSGLYFYLYHVSRSEEDWRRLERASDRERWPEEGTRLGGKCAVWANPAPWLAYLEGRNPSHPERILDDTEREIRRRLDLSDADNPDPETWDCHHWQQRNPVVTGGLAQLTWGSDMLYHGGLVFAQVRHFDPANRRPGLPEGVAALVERVDSDSIALCLANTDSRESRDVVTQAGAFGEHRFVSASAIDGDGKEGTRVEIGDKRLLVRLAPGSQIRLRIELERYAHRPSYAVPW